MIYTYHSLLKSQLGGTEGFLQCVVGTPTCWHAQRYKQQTLNVIFSRFDGQRPLGGPNTNFIKNQCKNKSDGSKISTKLGDIRKSYDRKMEQKETTLIGVFPNSIESGPIACHKQGRLPICRQNATSDPI